VVGACATQPRPRALQRLGLLQQARGPLERRLCLVAAYPPRLELPDLEPQIGAVGGDRERLLEIADCLLERCQRPCLCGGADELRDRFQVRTCEPKVAGGLGRPRDPA
jgi:hypothetical protein